MDAKINDSPSTLQQYLRFTTTRKRFEPDRNLFIFPLVHSAPLNTIVPIIELPRLHIPHLRYLKQEIFFSSATIRAGY